MLKGSFKQNFGAIAVALIAIFMGATFLLTRPVQGTQTLSTVSGLMSLQTAAAGAMPYSEAIANQKPTLIEFYADWCTTCQTMAPTLAKANERFASDVNFVMLNIDEPQWQSEIATYKVSGVPHFVLLEEDQTLVDSFIGKIPFQILSDRLTSLVG
ncbi:Thioredoxin domain-containing protein [[Leptolyngbya] sp. PCC 7376]|uniref:thioredoxin domain-containing protein n=1 Tax=[Leptolyngbya] sp. PCC 7376 TaxID=111781 RepID=UPI00029ECF88|nr:thioredoxin domain-containing protein [[Leptolyngbya] sp. PCC 7376]AFY39175.1 Thioredoxin domain-containing protein [[Leptolyngbya] sp. PCC 7376]